MIIGITPHELRVRASDISSNSQVPARDKHTIIVLRWAAGTIERLTKKMVLRGKEIDRLQLDKKRLDYADDRLARENAFRFRDATQPSTLRGIIDERMAKDPDANKLPGI